VKPIDTPRVDDLLARMSLAQKVGQMTQPERQFIDPGEVRAFHIGSVLSGGGSAPGANRPADWVAMNDAYWAASTDTSEGGLGIPLLYGVDAIHGNNNVLGATIFPHNIGLGATHDPDLVRRIARVTAREILACGVEWTFAPTLAVARNPRWGRTYESYATMPGRVADYAAPFVEGMQADGGASEGVVACAKHWVGDGGTRDGVDQGETTLSEVVLRNTHIRPYIPAIEAGVLTVMASYNSWNNVRCHGNRRLLTDILKDELGFAGFVVSDWNGIDQLSSDYSRAIEISVNAGVDMFMVPEEWRTFIARTMELVEAGRIPLERIDDAVRRILRVKEAYGLFDLPRPAERSLSNSSSFGSPEHRAVAREAVRRSLVLLKNEGALPVPSDARVLVAGRAADSRGHLCGGFTVAWQGSHGNDVVEGGTSIWEAVASRSDTAVLSADGSAEGDFDVALVVVGENPYAEGFGDVRPHGKVELGSALPNPGPQVSLTPYAATLEHRANHPEDLATIERIRARGIPVVTVFVSGRPLVTEAELEASDAFVAVWLPGSEGAGVTDVLFGDHDFEGRLTFPWPRSLKPAAVPRHEVGFGLRY
jgi:beta-glucosidase